MNWRCMGRAGPELLFDSVKVGGGPQLKSKREVRWAGVWLWRQLEAVVGRWVLKGPVFLWHCCLQLAAISNRTNAPASIV